MPFRRYGAESSASSFGTSVSLHTAPTSLSNDNSLTSDPPPTHSKINIVATSEYGHAIKSPPSKNVTKDPSSESPSWVRNESRKIMSNSSHRARSKSPPLLRQDFSDVSRKRLPTLTDNNHAKLPKHHGDGHNEHSNDDLWHHHQRARTVSAPSMVSQVSPANKTTHSSRFLLSSIQEFRPNGEEVDIYYQKEESAKEKRLRRFNVDVDVTAKSSLKIGVPFEQSKGYGLMHGESMQSSDPFDDYFMELEGPDNLMERDWQLAEAIRGSCPDMCPESERLERERKGDLDKLERINGDRNRTSRDVAVKKYNRTSEKDATLIRPPSVLLLTMDHLLHLLDRAYDEELLGLHGFLWDRMRAIRMDLRMQHIFNHQAITMYEQMIRFHILAMHELCEYSKGEGLTEGFDAHLNIEQMNKASIELFHMYDDLRKSGNACANEAEFRGYYALLKLDKHPGYMVEPAELSLDLAKMNPEMRNTSEVQFARRVTRASRTGNYLMFFRFARDATYLQACLMHARFAKLRSQAMASLYSGLQKNQGVPILQVAEWLAMEAEDIEALVEYHGFSLKTYEELYMAKDGPFLNKTWDFPTGRSKLVEDKRSHTIKVDVVTSGREKIVRVVSFNRQADIQIMDALPPEEDILDYDEDEPTIVEQLDMQNSEDENHDIWFNAQPSLPQATEVARFADVHEPVLVPNKENIRAKHLWMENLAPQAEQKDSLPFDLSGHWMYARDESLYMVVKPVELRIADKFEEGMSKPFQVVTQKDGGRGSLALQEEVNRVKVRLLLRSWRMRAVSRAEERRWRMRKLEAALGSFHLGVPINEKVYSYTESIPTKFGHSGSTVELDLEQIQQSRIHKLECMTVRLDIGRIIMPILKQKNPSSRFIWWKLLICLSSFRTSGKQHMLIEWMQTKLSISEELGSISAYQSIDDRCKLFYVAKDVQCQNVKVVFQEVSQGTSGLLFLLHESCSVVDERTRLWNFIEMINPAMKLPLLVLFAHASESIKGIEDSLELNKLDKSKVACWSVLPIAENNQFIECFEFQHATNQSIANSVGFFDETKLTEGLSWLALKAPAQRNLRHLHVQELVLEHLQPSVKGLLSNEPSQIVPQMCIQAFNDALLNSATEIKDAAESLYCHCPPYELREMIENEAAGYGLHLPFPSESEGMNVDGILDAINTALLPPFQTETLSHECGPLKRQKLLLENSLREYLIQFCASHQGDFPTQQLVDAILQKGCVFKQTNAGRILVPNWVVIFQHIFNIQIGLLYGDPPPIVWVHPCNHGIEASFLSMYGNSTDSLTLDGMIEMEARQSALIERCSNTVDATKSIEAKDQLQGLMLRPPVTWDSTAVFRVGLDDVYSYRRNLSDFLCWIEPPRAEERDLQNLVYEFCRKVDQVKAEVAKNSDVQIVELLEIESQSNVGFITDAVPSFRHATLPETGVSVLTNEPNSLMKLLAQCEEVQVDIDKKLKGFELKESMFTF